MYLGAYRNVDAAAIYYLPSLCLSLQISKVDGET